MVGSGRTTWLRRARLERGRLGAAAAAASSLDVRRWRRRARLGRGRSAAATVVASSMNGRRR
ncbi:hypothetical protein ACP70R_023076 [Stipagrostis hirtigluma subsp. patula]